MSRRRRQGLSPTLFPFLAVLVCTLGTLILFLALVAQSATEAAEQNSRARQREQAMRQAAKPKPVVSRLKAEEVETLIEDEQFRIEQFLGIRDNLTADIENRRDQVTYLDEQIAKVRRQLKQLNDQVETAIGSTAAEPIDDKAIAELRAKIDAQQQIVEELRGRAGSETPRIVIVPHKGPNGTDRRAIYIECRSDGVTIWPEGSRITLAQLEAARSSNPLDAALRVIRLHAMRHYGDSTPPYPLLVVRPDGIRAYGAARLAMRDWDDQFGYELVPQDVELAYTKPDSGLKQKVDLAIRSAASKQSPQQAIARNRRIGGAGGRLPTLSAASLDRAGRASGYQSGRDSYSPFPYRPEPFPSSDAEPKSLGDLPSNYGSLRGGAEGRFESDQQASGASTEPTQLSQQSGSGIGGAGNSSYQAPYQTPATPGRSKRLAQQINPYAGSPGSAAANSAAANSASANSAAASNPSAGRRSGQHANQPQPLRDPPGLSSSGQGAAADSSAPSQSSRAGQIDSQLRGGNGGTRQAPAMRSQQSRSASPTMDRSMMSAQQMIGAQPDAPPLVRRQGNNWALPSHIAGMRGNAIVRTIRLRCFGDRFELRSSAGGGQRMFSFADGDIDTASLQMATAVRDRIDRWGAALPGGRWQPRLEVEVMPGGQQSHRQLQALMRGSGIELTERGAR